MLELGDGVVATYVWEDIISVIHLKNIVLVNELHEIISSWEGMSVCVVENSHERGSITVICLSH